MAATTRFRVECFPRLEFPIQPSAKIGFPWQSSVDFVPDGEPVGTRAVGNLYPVPNIELHQLCMELTTTSSQSTKVMYH